MTMNSNSNNINYNYDEQAKIMLDRFIFQLNTSSRKADPDDASADLKYTRALQKARLLKNGVTMSVDYSQNYDKMIKGIAWKMDKDARYITRIPFHAVKYHVAQGADRRRLCMPSLRRGNARQQAHKRLRVLRNAVFAA